MDILCLLVTNPAHKMHKTIYMHICMHISGMLLVVQELRQRMEINNTAELVVGQEGSPLYLVTKDKNQFLQYRELFLRFHQV